MRVLYIFLLFSLGLHGQVAKDLEVVEEMYSEGKRLYYEGRYEEAISKFDSTLKIGYAKLTDTFNVFVSAEQRLGYTYAKVKKYDLAKDHLFKALDKAEVLYGDKSARAASVLGDIGVMYARMGLYTKSIEWNLKSIDIKKEAFGEKSLEVAFTKMNNTQNIYSKGNYSKCIAEYNQILEIFQKELSPEDENFNRVYLSMSNAFRKKGDLENALTYALKALEIKLINYEPDHPSVPKYYDNVAKVLVAQGKLEEASEYFKKAKSGIIKHGDSQDVGSFINDEARVYLANNDPEVALEKFKMAAKLLSINEEKTKIAEINIATCLYAMGRTEEAYDKLKTISLERLKDEIQLDLAEMALEMERYDLAEGHFLEGSKSIPEGDEIIALRYLFMEAKLRRQSNREQAWNLISEVIDRLIKLRRTYTGSASKDFINDELENIFEFAVDLALERWNREKESRKNFSELFTMVEMAKAAMFWDDLSEDNASYYGGVPSEFLDELEVLRAGGIEKQVELEKKMRVLEENYPQYYNIKYALSVPELNEVQEEIPEDMAVMDYFVFDSIVVNLVVTKNELDVLTYKNSGELDFVAELDAMTKLISRISVIPHKFIHFIAFDQIQHPETGEYLLFDYAFSYQLNIERLIAHYRPIENDKYIGFVPTWELTLSENQAFRSALVPLPGALKEVESVSNLMQGNVFRDQMASESAFYKEAPAYGMIHFATHAEVDPENELNSVLYLQAENEEMDGKLEMDEIMNTELHADLVILSACETGSGGLRTGEGVMSLARAFQYAGANSVLMSLWRANDNSAHPIIFEFMKNYKAGLSKDVALQQSKIKYLTQADPLFRDEFYWAGYVISGALDSTQKNSIWHIYLLIGLAIIFISFLIIKFV